MLYPLYASAYWHTQIVSIFTLFCELHIVNQLCNLPPPKIYHNHNSSLQIMYSYISKAYMSN